MKRSDLMDLWSVLKDIGVLPSGGRDTYAGFESRISRRIEMLHDVSLIEPPPAAPVQCRSAHDAAEAKEPPRGLNVLVHHHVFGHPVLGDWATLPKYATDGLAARDVFHKMLHGGFVASTYWDSSIVAPDRLYTVNFRLRYGRKVTAEATHVRWSVAVCWAALRAMGAPEADIDAAMYTWKVFE